MNHPMLAEVRPFRDPAAGQHQLADLLNQANAGKNFHRPILDWLHTKKFGEPTLIFDTELIEQRMQWLGELARPLSITPLVAVKSCPDAQYLGLGHKHLDGFDTSNLAEYSCLPDNLKGKLVSVTAPDLNTDFSGFISRGNTAVIALDSLTQLNHYFSQQPTIPYILRIQGSDLMKSMDPPDPAYFPATRFGFTIDEVKQLLQHPQVRSNPPAGFHVHHGSEQNRPSTCRAIISGLKQLARQLPVALQYINLGGGWHSLNQEEISDILTEARSAFPLPCSILLEPGRWYAEGAGFAIGTIVNQTQSGGTIKYTINLSGRSHLHWSEAQLIHPIEARSSKACEVQFFGPSCYEADRVGKFLLPFHNDFFQESGLTLGKTVIFSHVSTYSAAWNTSFNGIPRAEVIWWKP